jgi:hypothetical protein
MYFHYKPWLLIQDLFDPETCPRPEHEDFPKRFLMEKLWGTGSKPDLKRGLHLASRKMVSTRPLMDP